MTTPTVHILVTINNPNLAELSLLVFKTLRVGFPTAEVRVDLNGEPASSYYGKVVRYPGTDIVLPHNTRIHHADWISRVVANATGPTVILDSDIILWRPVEHWTFAPGTLLAGRYIPRIWNEWSGCPSVPRLHTSMLWLPDPPRLREALRTIYPRSHEPLGEYCPCDPWSPAVRFDMGRPTFWDTAAGAFNMLPQKSYLFGPGELSSYTHINSPTFHDVFVHRLSDPQAYENVLSIATKEPDRLRDFWQAENLYYKEMQQRLNEYDKTHNPHQ